MVHPAFFGEVLSEDDRRFWIDKVRSGNPEEQAEAMDALSGDHSRAYLEALLVALAGGNTARSSNLLRFVDEDPRVRPALVEAMKNASPPGVSDLAYSVGLAGGEGALAALRGRLHEAVATAGTLDTPRENWQTDGRIVKLTHAVLRLDPDATDAAEQMIAVYRRTKLSLRWEIVERVVEVIRARLCTAAAHILNRELELLLSGEDFDSLIVAAPALARGHFKRVHDHCERALWSPWEDSRRHATIALSSMPFPYAGRSLVTLAGWLLDVEHDIDEALWVAGLVHELIPPEETASMLERALASAAPSVRWNATGYIKNIAPEAPFLELLKAALASEPDPLLRRDMGSVLAAADGSGDRVQERD